MLVYKQPFFYIRSFTPHALVKIIYTCKWMFIMHPLVCTVPIQRMYVSHIGIATICMFFSLFIYASKIGPFICKKSDTWKFIIKWADLFIWDWNIYEFIIWTVCLQGIGIQWNSIVDGMWLWIRIYKNLSSYGLFAWKE